MEKVFIVCVSVKRFVSRTYKQLLQINTKNPTIQFLKK